MTTRTICSVSGSTLLYSHDKYREQNHKKCQHKSQQRPKNQMIHVLFASLRLVWVIENFLEKYIKNTIIISSPKVIIELFKTTYTIQIFTVTRNWITHILLALHIQTHSLILVEITVRSEIGRASTIARKTSGIDHFTNRVMLARATLTGRELTLLSRVSILALASVLILFNVVRDEAQATILTCSLFHHQALLTDMCLLTACAIIEFKACTKEGARCVDALALCRAWVLDVDTFVHVLCAIGASPALWTLTLIEVVLKELGRLFVDT